MLENEKNTKKIENDSQVVNNNINNSAQKNKSLENVEDELDKEEPNFDSIDFNINPFNNNTEVTNKKNENDSEDFFFEQVEEDDDTIKINKNTNNINAINNINIIPNISNNPQFNLSPKNTNINQNNNNNNNNCFPNFHNNNGSGNYLNYNNSNNNMNNNNSYSNIGYGNNVINNSNLFNINFDFKAAPFFPENNNIPINPNINNLNINNNNNLFQGKDRQSWICWYCQNFNSKSKY